LISLSTTHKAKGLEFLNVKLANDFFSLFDKNDKLINKNYIKQEEINIYYVAMTRAIYKLELNTELKKFFKETIK
jgi:superfamily I DNA/RNA helicase